MVTLKDVAAACGVSPATVSRALNATGDNPSRHVRYIRHVADNMGYRPNAAARALKTNRSDNIGILYEDVMQHEYFSSLIEGLRLGAEKRGYDLTFLARHFDGEGKVYVAEAEYRSLDGIIVVQADYASSRILSLTGCGLPTVVVDNRLEGCGTVFSDNAAGMEKLVRHVASLGHRRVAFIGGTREALPAFGWEAFTRAAPKAASGLPPNGYSTRITGIPKAASARWIRFLWGT